MLYTYEVPGFEESVDDAPPWLAGAAENENGGFVGRHIVYQGWFCASSREDPSTL